MPEEPFDVVAEIYVDAAPDVVFSFFVDPDELARWRGSPRHVDPRPGGSFRIAVSDDELAVGQFLMVEPNRRLVFTWGLDGGREAVAPGSSVVDVSFTPERRGTVVRVVHRLLTERGDDVADTPTLYNRRPADQPDLLRCEWCARPAQVVPIHVTWPDGQRELGEPVLCPVCAAIFELGPPLRDVDRDPKARVVAVERRRQEAKGIVCDLLAERYAADGKPTPAWMTKPAR